MPDAQKIVSLEELSKTVHEATGLSRTVVRKLITSTCEAIADVLRNGDCARIQNFGTFIPYERAAMNARNMQTGEVIEVAARMHVKFRPSEKLLERVRGEQK